VAGVLTACAMPVAGVAREPELRRDRYSSEVTGERHEYFVYLPGDYAAAHSRWPLLLFLHGAGERGNGRDELERVLRHGPLFEAWIMRRDLPFVIVSPQLPVLGDPPVSEEDATAAAPRRDPAGAPPRRAHFRMFEPGHRAAHPIARTDADDYPPGPYQRYDPYPGPGALSGGWFRIEPDLIAILDAVESRYRIDPDRVYVTGLSLGAFGSFDLAARHPQRFAAIATVVGTGRLEDAPGLAAAGIPIWMFGSGVDPVVKPHWLYQMARALEEAGHPELRFTVHEDMTHDAWRRVYEGSDLYDWLLAQRRRMPADAGAADGAAK
jgi:predicted peptidase